MTSLESVLAEHRIDAYGPTDCRCFCGRKWFGHTDYRTHVAAAIRAWLLNDETVEVGAAAFYEQFDSNPHHRRTWPAPEQHIPWWMKNARAVLAAITEGDPS